MNDEIQAIGSIDRMIHEPARLAIMAVLAARKSADFNALLTLTGLSRGNLSAQLQKLEEAGYVVITKSFRARYSHTDCALSEAGRTAFRQYWQQYRALEQALGPALNDKA